MPTWPRLDLLPPEHVLSGLRDWGRVILTNREYLNDADRAVVEQAVQQLRLAESELLGLLGRVNGPAAARELLQQIAAVAAAAYVVGAHGGMTDTARVFFERSRATHMRIRRAASIEEQELLTAIEAAVEASRGAIPSGHPYKDAYSIRDSVNQRLLGRRKPASVDVIARRLRPRSSRTRRK